ncbi:unnamed protein product [Mesocestoides corti]|uniref:SCP domain-containing protein n=1 Tax=Mesocestoides corti TaxID=53468 RepID=A0A0R3UMT5_MESCO|nr:unnamed protein product [Mesocestoides corti]
MKQATICLLALICYVAAEVPSKQERRLIVQAHTKIREGVSPSASDMKMMKYSKKLEEQAEKSLTECIVEDPLVTAYSDNETQNMRMYFDKKPTYADMINDLADDAQYYDYDANTCTEDCTQYKRIVWADSTRVGCAMHKCGYLDSEQSRPVYVVICQYDPMQGIEERRPYVKGRSCSKCPAGDICRRKQCVKQQEQAQMRRA